jgi:hypothetical protein
MLLNPDFPKSPLESDKYQTWPANSSRAQFLGQHPGLALKIKNKSPVTPQG